jgi:PLP dependent protein
MFEISANLEIVKEELSQAAKAAGRDVSSITLMAVSKTWPVEHVEFAVAAGHRVFGENKVQEAELKVPLMSAELEWHMIGHLQRNKVRKALSLFDYVHGIESLKLAAYSDSVAADLGTKAKVFLQVNIGAEPQKSGFDPNELKLQANELCQLDHLQIVGLMCIPPAAEDPEDSRKWFAATRELRDEMERYSGLQLPHLSMGMSSDYAVAIEEGATIVRVGSAIFGSRNYTHK